MTSDTRGRNTPLDMESDHSMIRVIWAGTVLAEAQHTVTVEGNHYFPAQALEWEHFSDSSTRTLCPWKGVARYYDVTVDGTTYPDGAWYYPRPTPFARRIKDHVAFWPGVEIRHSGTQRAGDHSGRGWLRTLLGGGE